MEACYKACVEAKARLPDDVREYIQQLLDDHAMQQNPIALQSQAAPDSSKIVSEIRFETGPFTESPQGDTACESVSAGLADAGFQSPTSFANIEGNSSVNNTITATSDSKNTSNNDTSFQPHQPHQLAPTPLLSLPVFNLNGRKSGSSDSSALTIRSKAKQPPQKQKSNQIIQTSPATFGIPPPPSHAGEASGSLSPTWC